MPDIGIEGELVVAVDATDPQHLRKRDVIHDFLEVGSAQRVYEWRIPISGDDLFGGEVFARIRVPLGKCLHASDVSALIEILRVTRDRLTRKERKSATVR